MSEDESNPPFASAVLFEYIALTDVLDRDVVASRSVLLVADTQFNRRQFVRAVTADIETTVGSMIRVALDVGDGTDDPFTASEYALLQERVREMLSVGAIHRAQSPVTTKTNIRFAFSVFTRAMRSTYSLPADESAWGELVETFAIRDRIALPKASTELDVTDDELRAVHAADVWFDKHSAEAMKFSRYAEMQRRA